MENAARKVLVIGRKELRWGNKAFMMENGAITTDVRQPWTNYVNNGNKHFIVGADVRSEYSNIRYLHLIIGKPKSLFQVTNMISEGRNHIPAANTNLLYFTL